MSRPKSGRGKSKTLVLDFIPMKQDQDRNSRIATIIRGYISMGYSDVEIARLIGGTRADIPWFLENY